MLELYDSHKLNPKWGVDLLDKYESELKREMEIYEVQELFYVALSEGFFSSLNKAPNGWRSKSSTERVDGREFAKGIDY
jgi:hypothetical protein